MGCALFLLFTAVPLVELYLLVWLGGLWGFWPTVALVLFTGLVGATLAKLEGLRVLGQWREALAEGRVPEAGVLDGLLVLVGGIFLVTPGVITDFLGFTLLIPPTRRLVAKVLRERIQKGIERGTVRVQVGGMGGLGGLGGFKGRGGFGPDGRGPGAPRGRAPEPRRGGGAIIDVEGRDVTAEADESGPDRLGDGS
ncbi:MAG: FxsA protein [Sandaracinus sp.]|nr:FxsA protein [Sandaracinus sp.]